MTDPPLYRGIFQHIAENSEVTKKSSLKERFWVEDLEENQYPRLVGPVSGEKVRFDTPEEAFSVIMEFAKEAGADLVGSTKVTPDLVFEGADVKGAYAVSVGLEMDREEIATAPEPPAGIEALRAYWKLGLVVLEVSLFIRSLGYQAQGHQVRTFLKDPPSVLHTLTAQRAGLGEVGRLGLLITKEFGPRLRLGTVTTELELPDIGKRAFGVDEFCSHCTICADECRGDAIPLEKKMERGVNKYTIDPFKCLPEFAKFDGCGICIAVCPFNRPINEMEWFLGGVEKMSK